MQGLKTRPPLSLSKGECINQNDYDDSGGNGGGDGDGVDDNEGGGGDYFLDCYIIKVNFTLICIISIIKLVVCKACDLNSFPYCEYRNMINLLVGLN